MILGDTHLWAGYVTDAWLHQPSIASFDLDFDRCPGVRRMTPGVS